MCYLSIPFDGFTKTTKQICDAFLAVNRADFCILSSFYIGFCIRKFYNLAVIFFHTFPCILAWSQSNVIQSRSEINISQQILQNFKRL